MSGEFNRECGYLDCDVVGSHVHRLTPEPPIELDDDALEWTDIDHLKEWWIEQARVEADKLAPKAVEYGSYDLAMVAEVMAEMMTRPPDLELGLVFYLVGKIARAASAVKDGRRPSDDTLVDIAIYARMILYVREHGQWP